ncbi:MAG TPA: hypothetical protein VEK83_15125 [Gemmatimonadales bacterium]|nr:hypothetical protein [Gemmatimonadales bacterium]
MASASRSRGWLIWVGIVLAACDKIPTVQPRPELQTYRATPDVWSGGELVVTSHGFAAESLPDILLDGQLLAVRRVDDTTVAAVAPDRPGPHTLRVVARVVDPHAVVVQLRGFVNRIEGPLLSGRTEPGRDTRYLFGSGPTGLRRWNIRTNKAIELGDTVHAVSCTRGVGPGPNVSDLVLLTGGCSTGRWLVWHTEPLYPLTDTASAMTDHFVAVLQTGRWVVLADATFSVTACDSGVCTAETIPGTAVSDVVRSPRRDRAVLLAGTIGDSGTPGVPVIDVGLGSVGYRVPALSAAQGAAFSSAGDTLYLAGESATAFTIVAVRASDGQLFASRSLDFEPCAVAPDQSRPWLYVAGVTTTGQSRLEVFDRETMQALTTLHVVTDIPYGHELCRILPNPVEHRVYVAETWAGEHNPAAHAQLYVFETPP